MEGILREGLHFVISLFFSADLMRCFPYIPLRKRSSQCSRGAARLPFRVPLPNYKVPTSSLERNTTFGSVIGGVRPVFHRALLAQPSQVDQQAFGPD